MEIMECEKYKEQGNDAFKTERWDEAVKYYSKAISGVKGEPKELAIYYKNRAAAHLKLEDFEKTLQDCDRSLEICPNDPKALFRRCQALESLQRYEEAFRDATQIFKDDPTNKSIQPYLQRLHRVVEERARINAQTHTKLETMVKIVFDPSNEKEKRETAMKNLLVLAKENAGSEVMIKQSCIVQKIKNLLKVEKNQTLYVTGIRIIGELCKHTEEKTKAVLKDAGVPWFLEILDSNSQEIVYAAQYCLQCILNSLSGMEMKSEGKPKQNLVEKNKGTIDTLLTCLTMAINNQAISGLARDAIIELLTKNIHHTAFSWAEHLVEKGGVKKLLDCASELEEFHYESSMSITSSTRTIAAVCLSRVYDNMYYDKARDNFLSQIQDFIKEKLLTPDIESKLRVTVVITELLRGPLDIGNSIIGKEGILEMILVMANTEDELQQKVACECLIAAASKADKARSIVTQGADILKKLYKSKNDHIRIRALVGLCKLGSYGGSDATIKPFAEGSTLKLAEACRRFLLHPGKDTDIRKWAAEGLSYLTLDAEVKEKLIEDKAALTALVELAKTGDQSMVFGVVTTLVNLCNAYEKQEVIPEMVELAKFAKQHIPEEHELDDPDFVTKRLIALGRENVTTALVALCKTESHNSRELISRVFNALASEHELRGMLVQQGAVKVLIKLALEGTEKGKRQAAQALARIGITMNPEVAFPGQRALECIRPMLSLLHQDCTGLENFEALMALCNIAQMNEAARQRIVKEGGFYKIEHYMYEDHQYISRAAVQCMCNLVQSEDIIQKFFTGDNDRVKYIVSCCLDEDEHTAMAASGTLAVLTGYCEKCCEKVFDSTNWLEAIQCLLANKSPSMQYRGVCIVANIISASKELANKLIESNVLEILMALKLVPDDGNRKRINEVIDEALQICEQKYSIIMKPPEEAGASGL
ncbi:protein unc-45 homolog B [Euwallacea fornicatus]|uniref:protein unc-45 homolog B n=1 Tax=Euwallacea fornicatus TaxID=995702 RepID=UPI00338F38A9